MIKIAIDDDDDDDDNDEVMIKLIILHAYTYLLIHRIDLMQK